MHTAPNKTEILALERRYWDAMKANDVDTAVALTKFPCTLVGPQGVRRITEAQYRQMMAAADGSQYEGVDFRNPQVDVLSDDTAMITYAIKHQGMDMLDVSTWVRERDRWVCAFHSETQIH